MNIRCDKPFGRSYWIIPGRFLAGYYPGAIDELETVTKLRTLVEYGIDSIIDLTEVDSQTMFGTLLKPYDSIISSLEIPTLYSRFPIEDLNVPSVKEMKKILDVIDHQIEIGKNVYVHCLGGIGRTGTVVGCWLRRHHEGIDAIKEISNLREGQDDMSWIESPETEIQKKMVMDWQYGQ
jgi:hypothetical protein